MKKFYYSSRDYIGRTYKETYTRKSRYIQIRYNTAGNPFFYIPGTPLLFRQFFENVKRMDLYSIRRNNRQRRRKNPPCRISGGNVLQAVIY